VNGYTDVVGEVVVGLSDEEENVSEPEEGEMKGTPSCTDSLLRLIGMGGAPCL